MCRFQGTADAVRQYSWIFEDLKNNAMQVRPPPPPPTVIHNSDPDRHVSSSWRMCMHDP